MPADKGMKLVELMQSAVECELDFGADRHTYVAGEQPRVAFNLVKSNQIRMPDGFVESAPVRRAPRLLK